MSSDRICVFFHDTATTEIYTDCHTLSLHDALPFCAAPDALRAAAALGCVEAEPVGGHLRPGLAVELHPRVEPLHRLRIDASRSEEHTSELQSLMRISYAVFCLKKKKKTQKMTNTTTSPRKITNNNTRTQKKI